MTSVRTAQIADIPTIVDMLTKFFSQLSLEPERTELDRKHVTHLLIGLIKGDHGHVIVLDNDGIPVGVLVAARMPGLAYPASQAVELAWWIEPDFRGARSAFDMLREYERWAREQNCSVIHMGCMTGLRGDDVARLYERAGFQNIQRDFVKFLPRLSNYQRRAPDA